MRTSFSPTSFGISANSGAHVSGNGLNAAAASSSVAFDELVPASERGQSQPAHAQPTDSTASHVRAE